MPVSPYSHLELSLAADLRAARERIAMLEKDAQARQQGVNLDGSARRETCESRDGLDDGALSVTAERDEGRLITAREYNSGEVSVPRSAPPAAEPGEALLLRVADAINRARYTPDGLPERGYADEDQSSQEYARRLARAAIKALRATPTRDADAPEVLSITEAFYTPLRDKFGGVPWNRLKELLASGSAQS